MFLLGNHSPPLALFHYLLSARDANGLARVKAICPTQLLPLNMGEKKIKNQNSRDLSSSVSTVQASQRLGYMCSRPNPVNSGWPSVGNVIKPCQFWRHLHWHSSKIEWASLTPSLFPSLTCVRHVQRENSVACLQTWNFSRNIDIEKCVKCVS